jgi:hypothetical protein
VIARGNRLLSVSLISFGLLGCAAFREGIPQIFYQAELVEPANAAICNELSQAMAVQTGLSVISHSDPRQPGSSCSTTLHEASNDDEVDIDCHGQTLNLIVRHHTWIGARRPNDATNRLADALLKVVQMRYPKSEMKRVTVYSNPFFGP